MAPDAYEEFTDRQRTRVVRRESDDQAATEASIGNTQSFSKHKERLFDDLSIAQIIAGAAAAATSVVLASRIGIAGSVIGAAVSSVVTVVSSQLYRRFLTASAEKLKKNVVAPAIGDDRHLARGKRSGSSYHAGGQDVTQPIAPDPIDISSGQATTWTSYGSTSGYAREAGGTPGAYASQGAQNGTAASAGSGTRIAPKRLQARAVAERSATQRKVVTFSIISAVVALVACTAVILVLTAGEGLGTRTTPIFAPATEELDASADTTVDTSENGTSSDEESQAATESNPIRARRATAPRPIRHRLRARATLPPAAPETERKEADRTRRREMVRIVPEAATARQAAPAVRNPARRTAPEAARAAEPRGRHLRRERRPAPPRLDRCREPPGA